MKTTNFKNIEEDVPAVSVVARPPEWIDIPVYDLLVPDNPPGSVNPEKFNESYRKKLDKLNALDIYKDLVGQYGKGVQLVSKSKPNMWDHRRAIACWFEWNLDIKVPEVGVSENELMSYKQLCEEGKQDFVEQSELTT